MSSLLTKDAIKNLEDLNRDAIKLYLESAEARLADTLDTKKQLEQKAFILFSGYIAAALAFFGLAEESNSIGFWLYSTAFVFCIGIIPLFISMKSSIYGNLGRHPKDWLEDEKYLTVKKEHEAHVLAYMLYDYMYRIDVSKKANERKALFLNIAVLFGMASLLPFTIKALFSL
jgi:hypothetical protein